MKRLLRALLLVCLSPAAQAADSRAVESMLAESLRALQAGQLDAALSQVDALLKQNPNFHLAQLLRGDLLLARAQPLTNFGNAPAAESDKLDGLRKEAQVRMRRIQQPPPADAIPSNLWQIAADQTHVLVVDTSRSTLYVYANNHGTPRYVTDFYVSIGKLGSDKVSEGDKRTPLGVYYVKEHLPSSKLTDFYGHDAYPISYPNEWDRQHGRSGHGIWLHGTPSNTYSRPPQDSSGCVVLTNEDLDKLGSYLQVGKTPVIITKHLDWMGDQDKQARDELMQAIEQWRSDWSRLDNAAYLGHYSRQFNNGSMNYNEWARYKQQVNAGKQWVKVELSGMSAFPYPGNNDLVVVDFDQNYASNNLSNRAKKRQYWQRQDGQWQIVYEGSN
jgi:murein L,D-transpeptidase YafK